MVKLRVKQGFVFSPKGKDSRLMPGTIYTPTTAEDADNRDPCWDVVGIVLEIVDEAKEAAAAKAKAKAAKEAKASK